MRILVVSAHYPPNFVSGGTLQPQRLARGLAARGHDVRVYAGWLGDRPPLETWNEHDGTGLAIRWIVTTPWIYWHLGENWDNPAVTADFRKHLSDVQPDVVHFHALQSLGAGLVREAAATSARVVITMHDFWWYCARQFLVDRDFQPCPLVIETGNCPCEVDRSWLEHRNSTLRRVLDRADLVLAPSESAAQVLAANGLDPHRLEVDENGLPDLGVDAQGAQGTVDPAASRPTAVVAPSPDQTALRLLYAGGPDRMKGVHVLFAALRQLAGRPGWHMDAYGAEGHVVEFGLNYADLPVLIRPAFDPSGAEEVFARSDVLVVPSVMRESHSLITREALSRGVPVVCTDSLGPEEVVQHGRNGLVVPAADAEALAGALRRLLDEPDLLPRLRSGCSGVAIRSLDDQVCGLERTFATQTTPRQAALRVPQRSALQRVLFVCGIEGAPLRYRALLPAEALKLLGITSDVRHYRDAGLAELSARADVVVIYRVPATLQILALITDVRRRGVPVFFDVDDLIFDPELAAEIPALQILPLDEAALWLEGVQRYRTTMEACDTYIGSTPELCHHASKVTDLPVEVYDNGVGVALARYSDAARRRPRRPGPLRVGYLSGTKTHDHDWFSIEPAVIEILDHNPEVELWLGGFLPPSVALDRFSTRVVRLPFLPWLELPAVLRDLDVNLAPLAPHSRFNEAKSAIKWLEAALTTTPTVASPTEPFRRAITHGQNGLLASSVDEWVHCMGRLLDDEAERTRLGNRAHRDALLGWSPHLQGARYRDLLERGRARAEDATAKHRPPSPWVPVALDEPPLPGLTPLDAPRQDVVVPPVVIEVAGNSKVGMHLRRVIARGWAALRHEGVKVTVGGAVRLARRQFLRELPRLRRAFDRTWRRRAK